MKETMPFVTIIMPIRNEAAFIECSLGSVLMQDYPQDRMEILVVDGMSNDGTREVVKKKVSQVTNHKSQLSIRLLDNTFYAVPFGLNIALKHTRGDIIIRVDGHCKIAPNYVRRCVEALQAAGADCVGGLQNPVGKGLIGNAIALVLTSPFGAGNALHRCSKQATWADTVYLGAYHRDVFDHIGKFDEEMVYNQDDEFNFRLIQAGGKIWLDPSICSIYYSRPTLQGLWLQYFRYGFYKVKVIQKRGRLLSWRHIAPPLFVLGLLGSMALAYFTDQILFAFIIVLSYVFLSLYFSLRVAKKDWKSMLILPLAFFILHFSYGIGFLLGLWQWRKTWKESKKMKGEVQRIKEVYCIYQQKRYAQRKWVKDSAGNRYVVNRRNKVLMNNLDKRRYLSLNDRKILDVGCGNGEVLANFLNYGANPENLYGIDLLPDRIEEAKRRCPELNFQCTNAERLNFPKQCFDLILFFTVFSSIFDENMAKNVSKEALRVLKNDGVVVLYDTRYPNPFNPHTRQITKKQIKRYFKECKFDFMSLTLIPSLSRFLAPLSFKLCYFLEKIPFLRCHYLVMIKKL